MNEIRYYKGLAAVEVLIKGKRKGKRGPLTWLVRELGTDRKFTTIPRLLWVKPKFVYDCQGFPSLCVEKSELKK